MLQYAPTTSLPAVPPGGMTAGLDWASTDHAVCVVDATGTPVARFTVEHTAAGLAELVRRLAKAGAGEVAIERGDGPVVDTLLTAEVTVVVISPNQLKNLRARYGSAGNKDDRFDAYVLADTLRTDRARLQALQPDSPATRTLRATVRARRDLVAHRVAVCNQLRAHLHTAFPGAVGLFAELDSPISLAFLARFDCQDRADWLSPKRLAAWLASNGYCGRKNPADLFQHLTAAPHGATDETGAALAHTTRALLATLRCLVEQIKALQAQIAEQLALHTDRPIFTSLPRSGTVRAARLLAEIGDCRARFPDPESLICLAGVAPSTRQSGKHTAVTFRCAADKQLRDAVCDFAADTRRANPWAAKLYNDAIARGKDHPHATRILARAWLYVIWHCWHDHVPYDPAKHRALQRLLKPRSTRGGLTQGYSCGLLVRVAHHKKLANPAHTHPPSRVLAPMLVVTHSVASHLQRVDAVLGDEMLLDRSWRVEADSSPVWYQKTYSGSSGGLAASGSSGQPRTLPPAVAPPVECGVLTATSAAGVWLERHQGRGGPRGARAGVADAGERPPLGASC